MTTHRDFDAAVREHTGDDPITFTLGGRTWPIRPVVASGDILALTAAGATDDLAALLVGYGKFLDAAIDWPAATLTMDEGMEPDDPHAALDAAIAPIDLVVLREIVRWIVQSILDRPFVPAPPSTG